jgi:acetylglutamate kinase
MEDNLTVVKIGGALLEDETALQAFYEAFSGMPGPKVLIHGGGQRASKLGKDLGIPPRMVDGRRITDARSLELVTMVYAGWANKKLVAGLQGHGCNALGLSGADADLIRARKRPVSKVDFGFVGDVEQVGTASLTALMQAGFVPVFCALTHDGRGQLLNTNADSIAAAVAIGLSANFRTKLIYCFEKEGVLGDVNNPESVLPHLHRADLEPLKQSGAVSTGMIPKLFNSFRALEEGVDQVWIGSVALLSGTARTFTQIRL